MRRVVQTIVVGVLLLVAAACGAGQDTTMPTTRPEIGFGHVHGVDVNPADGLFYAATHYGVFRLGPEGPNRVADRYQDTMGFTIVGPDRFLGSGHPDLRDPGPVHLGLMVSTDAARSWKTLSLRGEADFHALSVAGTTVYGWNSTTQTIMRSDDDGISWQRGATAALSDLDADPRDLPLRLLAASKDGLLESNDGGLTLSRVAVQPPQPLLLLDHVGDTGADREPTLAGVDAAGRIWALTRSRWAAAGALPAPPQAFTVIGPDRYLAATADGVFLSEDAGRRWTLAAATSP